MPSLDTTTNTTRSAFYFVLGQVVQLYIDKQEVDIQIFGGSLIRVQLDNDPNFQQTGVKRRLDSNGNVLLGSIACVLTDGNQIYKIMKMWSHRFDMQDTDGTIKQTIRQRLDEGEVKIESVRKTGDSTASAGRIGSSVYCDNTGAVHLWPANPSDFIDLYQDGLLDIHIDRLRFITADGYSIRTESDGTLKIEKRAADDSDETEVPKVSISADATGNITIENPNASFKITADGNLLHNDGTENIVLGQVFKTFMKELLTQIKAITVPTGVGPSGTPVNLPAFEQIEVNYITNDAILSDTSFVKK